MNIEELRDIAKTGVKHGKMIAIDPTYVLRLIEAADAFDDAAKYYDQGHVASSLIDPFWERYFRVAKGKPASISNYLRGDT